VSAFFFTDRWWDLLVPMITIGLDYTFRCPVPLHRKDEE
jgi:hypothetical protein